MKHGANLIGPHPDEIWRWFQTLAAPDAVTLAYWIWAGVSAVVASLVLGVWWHRRARAQRDTVTSLAGFMALAFAGDSVNKWWFGFSRWHGPDGRIQYWMLDHGFIVVFSIVFIAGALGHVRLFTSKSFGETGWLAVLMGSFVAAWFLSRLFA